MARVSMRNHDIICRTLTVSTVPVQDECISRTFTRRQEGFMVDGCSGSKTKHEYMYNKGSQIKDFMNI